MVIPVMRAPIHAGTPLVAQQTDTARIAPITITATRVPISAISSPATVDVITGDELRLRGTTSIAFAFAWVLANRLVTAAIAGPRTEAQWDSYFDALKLELGPDDEKIVDSLVSPGHASTPGYTDPLFPVTGRPVRF